MDIPFQRICTYGPILVTSIFTIVLVSGTYSTVQLVAVPGKIAVEILNLFGLLYPACLFSIYCYIGCVNGPGFIQSGWSPESNDDKKYLQYCATCQGYKAPRAHHCRTCGRCVLKLDHHCALIATCVGHENHMKFIVMLISSLVTLFQCIFINSWYLYNLVNKVFHIHRGVFPVSIYTRYLSILGISVGVGGSIGVLVLLYSQVKALVTNRTYIEELICAKAVQRRMKNTHLKPFVYPYDLGWRDNINQVFRWDFLPVGNGYDWPIKQGCDKHSLTVEQTEQKKEKLKDGNIVDNKEFKVD